MTLYERQAGDAIRIATAYAREGRHDTAGRVIADAVTDLVATRGTSEADNRDRDVQVARLAAAWDQLREAAGR